jgi:hypothetical protein
MRRTWFYTPAICKPRFCLFAVAFLQVLTLNGLAWNPSGGPSFDKVFGDAYIHAREYLDPYVDLDAVLIHSGVSPAFGKAVVFPEVIRYSALQDVIETGALCTLYAQYGQKYADFSIGRFQMKPSFAWLIERDVRQLTNLSDHDLARTDTTDTPQARLARVKRLESAEWQVKYLVAFILIMDSRYGKEYPAEDERKLGFYATAYNCGYNHSAVIIKRNMARADFHTGLTRSGKCYNYADIAADYYRATRGNL